MQTYTSELWKGSLAHWPGWRILLFISTFFVCPPLWLIFALPLNNKYNKTPIVKFGCYLTSHLFFMVVQVLTACIPIYPIYRESLAPYWIEWLLLIWLSGLLLGELISPQDKSGLGRIKIIIILLLLVSKTTKVASIKQGYQTGKYLKLMEKAKMILNDVVFLRLQGTCLLLI